MGRPDEAAVAWLLGSDEPGIRYRARTELLDEDPRHPDLVALARTAADGPKARALLSFTGVAPYAKWAGAHWRLVSLVELGLGSRHPAAEAACDTVLDAWASDRWLGTARAVRGLVRAHASIYGNALAVACRLGLAGDERAGRLAGVLCDWQWPDGGWNCDRRATRRSSFHESLPAAWGLIEYHRATGEPRAGEAATRTAELFLAHRLFRTLSTGEVIHPSFVKLHWPPYWHYDVLQALRVLALLDGALVDERASDAFELLANKRLKDGRWRPGGRWWRPPDQAGGAGGTAVEAVDWAHTGHEMVTFNALLARKAAGLMAR